MKRSLSPCLAALLLLGLLAGCHRAPTDPPTVPTTDPIGSAETESIPTENPAVPGETDLVLPDSTTSGGVQVWTDPSVYAPYTPVRGKYTRLAEGPLDRFVPSDEYGRVYPYVARRLVGAGKEGYDWEAGSLYGMMDRSGRILTDGLYVQAEPLMFTDYAHEDSVCLPLWKVTQVPEAHRVYGDGDGSFWVDGEERCGVIAMDGSFALDCDYLSVMPLQDRFYTVESWNSPSFTVYDLTGRPLITGAELFPGENFDSENDWWSLSYGEGLYVTGRYRSTEQNECWFLDEAGNRVLGPYADAGPFREGLACVSTDGSSYGYIDKTGAVVIDEIYDTNADFHHQRAVQYRDGEYILLDPTGKVLLRSENWFEERNQIFQLYDYEENETVLYDQNGRFLLRVPNVCSLVDDETLIEYGHHEDSVLYSLIPGREELELPGLGWNLIPTMMPLDGALQRGYYSWQYDEESQQCFIPYDLSGLRWLETGSGPKSQVYNDFYYVRDRITQEDWCFYWQGNGWLATTLEGKQRFIPTDRYVEMMDGLARVVTERACVFYDETGEILFSYPLDFED